MREVEVYTPLIFKLNNKWSASLPGSSLQVKVPPMSIASRVFGYKGLSEIFREKKSLLLLLSTKLFFSVAQLAAPPLYGLTCSNSSLSGEEVSIFERWLYYIR
jgi:hypothetical protein